MGDPDAGAPEPEATQPDDGAGFGRWGIVRQVASVVLVAAIIGALGAVALTGGAIVPDSPEPDGPTRVLGATADAPRERATVPAVVGLPQVYAMAVLRKAGFTGVISVSRPDERVGKGKVANQIPAADSDAAKGTEVQLALSLGPEDRPVPNLVGYPINGALTLLERAGMGYTATVEVSDQPSGTVLRTQPAAGEKRPKGTTVALVLSGGPVIRWDSLLLAAGTDSWLQPAWDQGVETAAPPVTAPAPARTTVTLPPAPARPPVTRPPTTRPPTTTPPTTRPPTTRPPTTQPSGPQCVTYPPRTYWDEVELRWVRVPMSTVCI